jgi:hypothetical protein
MPGYSSDDDTCAAPAPDASNIGNSEEAIKLSFGNPTGPDPKGPLKSYFGGTLISLFLTNFFYLV